MNKNEIATFVKNAPNTKIEGRFKRALRSLDKAEKHFERGKKMLAKYKKAAA